MSSEPTERRGGPALDWNQVMARLQSSTTALQQGTRLSPEQKRALLRKRAQELSQTEVVAPQEVHVLTVLGFRLGTRNFALESTCVTEVLPYRDIVPVPCTPTHILGLINARGHILSVTDLRVFLGIPPSRATGESKIVVITSPQLQFGVLVDGLFDIREIVVESIARPQRDGQSVDFVWGTTPDGVVVIDVSRLLADRRLVIGE